MLLYRHYFLDPADSVARTVDQLYYLLESGRGRGSTRRHGLPFAVVLGSAHQRDPV